MKVIAGKYKGQKLRSVDSACVRPTSGIVKESIFNILGDRVRNESVLDLFAGTGALGIEAISRGAKRAVFIDSNKESIKSINLNLSKLKLKADVIKWNIIKNLNCLKRLSFNFGVVFIDPPYGFNGIVPVLVNLLDAKVLTSENYVIFEHGKEDVFPKKIFNLKLMNQRRYGKSVLSFFEG